jgi:tetratricopeptide (TPR) repeat protein
MALDEFDKARECYEMLVQRIPKFAEGYYRLSSLAMDKGDTPKAVEYIREAIQIEPDNTTYLGFYVTLLTELRKFNEALQVLDELIELDPKSKTYLLAKAELSLSLKRYDEADRAYRTLLKLKPKDSTSRELMRAYFEAIGDNEALKKLNK